MPTPVPNPLTAPQPIAPPARAVAADDEHARGGADQADGDGQTGHRLGRPAPARDAGQEVRGAVAEGREQCEHDRHPRQIIAGIRRW